MPTQSYTYVGFETDTAVDKQKPGRGRRATNVRVEPTYLTWAWGNLLRAVVLPAGTNHAVDAIFDKVGMRIVWLVYNSAGQHSVVHYLLATGVSQVVLTLPALNFWAVRGRSQGNILDRFLIYLDASGAVRKVNLTRALAGEYTAAVLTADPYALHLVPQPPRLPPTAVRMTNDSPTDPRARTNRIAASAWQFAFQYEYQDAARTVLSPFSDILPPRITVAPLTTTPGTPDERNFIRVGYPTGLLGPSPLVRHVRLLVRKENELAWLVAGKFVPGLDFDFYGDTTGEVIPTATATKYVEALPVTVGTLTVGESRVFIGDCGDPYDHTLAPGDLTAIAVPQPQPAPTAITVYETTTNYNYTEDGGDGLPYGLTGSRVRLYALATGAYPNSGSTYYRIYRHTDGRYYVEGYPTTYTYFQAFEEMQADEYGTVALATSAGDLGPIDGPVQAERTFHDRTGYEVAVAFQDGLGRTVGAESAVSVFIPRQDYATPQARVIRWSLPAGIVPPPWAKTYCLLLSTNRSLSNFVQFRATEVRQYRGDNPDGSLDLRPITENGLAFIKQVWISVAPLLSQGRGFTLEAGSRLRFVEDDGSWYDWPILEQKGEYVVLAAPAMHLFNTPPAGHTALTDTPLVELYNPAPAQTTQTLYETGPLYPIANAGTSTAALTKTSGILVGDCAYLPLPGVVESMLPSTSAWGAWLDARRGRPVFLLDEPVGQARRKAQIGFSNKLLAGTQLNGLGEFDADAIYDLPIEQGAVTGLRMASQTQEDGTVLVALQERGGESLYLGKVPLSSATGDTAVVALSDRVIGGANPLTGGYGTRFPGSIAPNGSGYLYYWDGDRAAPCRYARDGVNNLAELYDCVDLFRDLAARYAGASVVGAYDPSTKEYLLFFGATDQEPPYTVAFSERNKAFSSDFTFAPDVAVGSDTHLFACQAGQLWHHHETAPPATFFGVFTAPSLLLEVDPAPGLGKSWVSIAQDADQPWGSVSMTAENGSQSRLLPQWFTRSQGFWQAAVRCNENTRGMTPAEGLHRGETMHSTTLTLRIAALPAQVAAPPVLRSIQVSFDVLNDQLIAPR